MIQNYCKISLADLLWETGKQIMDLEITLGSGEKSSSCKITLADPLHVIAKALISHSLKNGGLKQLENTTNKTDELKIPPPPVEGKNGEGTLATGEGFDARTKAFLDTICLHEVPNPLSRQSYYSNNTIAAGYFTDADVAAGGGYPASAGTTKNVGRYQFNRGDWAEAVKAGAIRAAYDPASQDGVALFKMNRINRGGKELRANDIEGALKKASNEWVSIPWNTKDGQLQPGVTKQEYLDYYAKRLAYYQGSPAKEKPKPIPTATKPTDPAVNNPKATGAKTDPKSDATSAAMGDKPVIKGSLITISLAGYQFEFVHQGTEMSESGVTVVMGQGVRWVMSRKTRSRTAKDVTLKQLAGNFAKSHKVTLDYQAKIDPTYEHIDQSGLSDYALLLRECEQAGLMITEEKGKMIIKERNQIGESKLTLSRGVNLISYKISDKALTGKEDAVSIHQPKAHKSTINAVLGKPVAIIPDKDRAAQTLPSVTGKTKAPTTGTLKEGQPSLENNKARTKRIGGLPSTFVLPLGLDTLPLVPLSAVETEGLGGVLDRIWVVKTVKYSLAAHTTTLEVSSPVEVVDSSPQGVVIPPGLKPTTNANDTLTTKLAGTGWVYPCTGIITSLWSLSRTLSGRTKPHRGCDIGAASGTPIYAADNGVATRNFYDGAGGGNVLTVKHENGWTTQYLHQRVPSPIQVGQKVKRGEQIGQVGNTGVGTGAHLHFEMYPGERGNGTNPGLVYRKMIAVGGNCIALTPCTS